MAQVFDDHSGQGGRIYASRNWNEVVSAVDRSEIDFRLQLRLVKDPKRRNVRPGEIIPFSQYPTDVAALRERRHKAGWMTGVIDGKFGNLADQNRYLERPPRFLNSGTVAFQCGLRSSEAASAASGWNSLPFVGGGTFEKKTPRLDAEKFPVRGMLAFSAWRSQHKDVNAATFGSYGRAKQPVDIQWAASLRPSGEGPNRTEGHRTEWLGRKKWYGSRTPQAAAHPDSGDLETREHDVKLEYIANVRHIIPRK